VSSEISGKIQKSPKNILTSVEAFDNFHPFGYAEPHLLSWGKKGGWR
jgi:hypothetical protein